MSSKPFANANPRDEIIFPFRRAGVDCGFLSAQDKDFVFKPTKLTAAVIDRETLKKNLRELVKSKKARIVKAGTSEVVAVPATRFMELYQ